MPKPLELRKVIEILRDYGVEFDSKSGGRHHGKFVKAGKSFPVKAHGMKTMILPFEKQPRRGEILIAKTPNTIKLQRSDILFRLLICRSSGA